jgi:uncharacterized membrane protein
MNAFLAGALGALTVIVVLFLATTLVHAAHRRRRARFRPRRALAFLFRGLGVRDEQRAALAPEADALAEELARLRVDARALRAEIASLLAAPSFDPAALRGALDRPFARAGELRARFEAALARVYATLEPAQRVALAERLRRRASARG